MRLAGRSVVVIRHLGGSIRRWGGTRRESGNAALCRPRSSSANPLRTTVVLHITQRFAHSATMLASGTPPDSLTTSGPDEAPPCPRRVHAACSRRVRARRGHTSAEGGRGEVGRRVDHHG